MEQWIKLLIQLGAGGIFAIIIIWMVFKLLGQFMIKKTKCNESPQNPRCINIPEVREALKNGILMKNATDRIATSLEKFSEGQIKMTSLLENIHEESKEQTKILNMISKNQNKGTYRR